MITNIERFHNTQRVTVSVLVLSMFFLIAGFDYYNTHRQTIVVPGDLSIDSKLKIAEEVSTEIWESRKLHNAVKRKYPSFTDEQMEGLFIKWHIFKYNPTSGDQKKFTNVQIVVGINYKGNLNEAKEIALLCRPIIEYELSQYLKQTNRQP